MQISTKKYMKNNFKEDQLLLNIHGPAWNKYIKII